MKKILYEKEILVGYATIIIAVLLDILIKLGIVHPSLIVNENYIFYVFSALCTVGTLGSAFISIVISVFSNRCLGFSMKEIINFPSSRIKVGNIIGISLIAIVIAIPLLAFDFINTITILAIYIVIYIFSKNKKLWELISDDNRLKETIYFEIKHQREYVDEEIIIDWFNRWFYELKAAIENKDENGQIQYLKLIRDTTEKCQVVDKKNAYSRLEDWIGEMFEFASHKLGFVEAYRKIILFNEISKNDIPFDVRTIINKSIEYLKYCEEKQISQANIYGNIDDIIWDLNVDKVLKIDILYRFYSVVFSNAVVHSDFKFSLLDSYFYEVGNFTSDQTIDEVLSQTILCIFRNGILQNEDKESRQRLYLILLKQLFVNNIYQKDSFFISTVSKIFRAIYFYAFLETETIREAYRTELQQMIGIKIDSMDNMLISLPRIIHENSDLVIEALIEDAVAEERHIDMFDYFPRGFGAKSSVWTRDMKLEFVFWIYCIFGYGFSIFPVNKYFDDINVSLETKKNICTIILNMFLDPEETLDRRTMENVKKLRLSLNTEQLLPVEYFRENFKYFNNQLKEIRREQPLITPKIDLEEINQELKKLLQKSSIIKFSSELTTNKEKAYQLLPKYIHSTEKTIIAARRIEYAIKDLINLFIENVLPKVELEFNSNGVNTLLNELNKDEILFRNYTFVDDWAFDKNATGTPKYKELCKKINDINYGRTNGINHYIFLSIQEIKVNAEVISYKRDILTDEQCEKYTEAFKIADGRYKIDGAVYNKSEAIKVVNDRIRIESAIVKVKTNISKNSGFRVGFKRR